jgi:hypothetical protein
MREPSMNRSRKIVNYREVISGGSGGKTQPILFA